MTKTKTPPQAISPRKLKQQAQAAKDASSGTVSVNGGPEVSFEALDEALDMLDHANNIYRLHPSDWPYFRTACDIGKKAAKAAYTSCDIAECTVGKSEAQTLEGYCDENLLRLEKVVGADIEMPRGARLAFMTCLRLYGGKLEKLKESEGGLLAPIEGTEDTLERVAKLIRTFGSDLELPLEA